MKNIFIVVEGYEEVKPTNAAAIVASNIIKELNKYPVDITVITSVIIKKPEIASITFEKEKYADVYYVKSYDHNSWKKEALNYFNDEFWDKQLDVTILSFSNPIQFSLFSAKVSKEYNIDFLQYYLDPHSMSQAVKHRYLYFPIRYLRDLIIHKYARKIFVTNELYIYSPYNIFFFFYQRKILDLGLPLPPPTHCDTSTIEKKYIRISYFGRFYNGIRNPNQVLNFLCENNPSYIINIYGETSDSYLKMSSDSTMYRNLYFHGFIDRNSILKEMCNSDILINIGNSVSNQLPSKILEYISFGKPIINFYSIKNDTSKKILEKYPYALNIDLNQNLDDKLIEVEKFIERMQSKTDIIDPNLIYKNITIAKITKQIFDICTTK